MKNYKVQRKLFNFIALYELLKQLCYSYGSDNYREKVRRKSLKKCMENAYKIPFYKERFDRVGLKPEDIKCVEDIAKLPVLTKQEYKEWIASEKVKSENEYCMVASTSGSSGQPLEVMNTPREYAADIANLIRTWMICGYNPILNITLTVLDESSENVGYKTFVQRLGILRREYVDERDDEKTIIDKINKLKPGLLQMYKSEMVRVAKYAQENHVEVFTPQYYEISGENVDEVSRRVLRETFGKNLINIYGCVENGPIAVERPNSKVYEIHEDLVAVNILDSENNITNDEGRIVFTTLYKNKFPLINYDIKDRGVKAETASGSVLTKIFGREDDVIQHEDGSTTGWIHLWYVISNEKNILQARFIQERYDIVKLQLVIKNESIESKDIIEKRIVEQLNERLKYKTRVQVEWVKDIPSDPNGKLRMVVNKINKKIR